MDVKELFAGAENGTLTYEQFVEASKKANAKFADLSTGDYVSKSKYEDELKVRDTRITELDGTIATRDTDLATLKQQLADAGTDASKLTELNSKLATLQSQYDEDTKKYKAQLDKQAYEFAVKEFANEQKFSSNAAKRDFVQTMIAKNLQMEGGKIIGGTDFVEIYAKENADAFVKKEKPAEDSKGGTPPKFVDTAGNPNPTDDNANAFHFNFAGVRPHK